MKPNQRKILIVAGLLVICSSQIAAHYTTLPDVVSGSIVGIGFGLLILALIKPLSGRFRKTSAQ